LNEDNLGVKQMAGPKVFQCNFSYGPTPHQLLGAAVGNLAALTNPDTGKATWRFAHQPLPVAGADEPGSLYVFGTAQYPVARMGGTVGLTIAAFPEGMPGTRFMADLNDSMGWDIATAERISDLTLMLMKQVLDAQFPRNGGWRMVRGDWRFGHRFDAPFGVAPAPP
jgi:hypothetical protein